jgi:predicted PurR-regulated permease PerM
MKKLLDNRVAQIGITAFLVIAASILFYYLILVLPAICKILGKIINILTPLIIGLVLAYIMHPIVNMFENKVFNKINKDTTRRNISILCTIVVILAIIIALVSVIIPQLLLSIQSLIINIPIYGKNIENALLNWISSSDVEQTVLENYDNIIEYVIKALNETVLPATNTAISNLSKGVFGLVSFFFNFAIGTVFAVYILANTKNFASGIRKTLYSLFNVEHVNEFIDEVKHINHVFCQFLIGKVCDSSIVALCTLTFLLIFRYPYPLLIAVIIGLTDLIPYFGPYIGSIPSALLICLVDPIKAVTFILFMVVLQQIDGNFITPRIQKQATGLPSFWVLFSITLFGGLFGVIGLLIAVPCFTIIYEICIDQINKRLKKKNMPTDNEFYTSIDGIEEKVIKAKIGEE